MNPAGL